MAPTKILKYDVKAMEMALRDVKAGIPVKTAARTHNVPKTTLYYKKIGKYPEQGQIGAPTILTKSEEEALVTWMLHLADTGFPATKDQLQDSVQMIMAKVKRDNKFKDNRPGRHWYELFLNRHQELSQRITQNLTSGRAKVSEQNIKNWFQEITEYFQKNNLIDVANNPNRVFNADEAAFFLCPKGSRVIARKGQKSVYSFVANDEKECITTLVCGNAAGLLPPPMVLYSYERIPPVISRLMPMNFSLGKTESGWMTAQTFYEYITNVFYPWLIENKIEFPIILYVDGHASHLTLPLSQFCNEKKIELVALYPNSTHILQPMDVAVFHPLKNAWKNAVYKWRMDHCGQKLKRENFAPLLEKSISGCLRPEILTNGFRTCGLCPLNAEAIDFTKIKNIKTAPNEVTTTTKMNQQDYRSIQLYVENFVGQEKLALFNSSYNTSWTGDLEFKELFNLWKKVKLEKESFNVDISENAIETVTVNDTDIEIFDNADNNFIYETDNFDTVSDEELLTQAENMENYLNKMADQFPIENETSRELTKLLIEDKVKSEDLENKISPDKDKNEIPEIYSTEKEIDREVSKSLTENIMKRDDLENGTSPKEKGLENKISSEKDKNEIPEIYSTEKEISKEVSKSLNEKKVEREHLEHKTRPEEKGEKIELAYDDLKIKNQKICIQQIVVIPPNTISPNKKKCVSKEPDDNNTVNIENIVEKDVAKEKMQRSVEKEGVEHNTTPENQKTSQINKDILTQNFNETSPQKVTPISHLNIPTPFKKCLFWPEPQKSQAKKKPKEKIPTVATAPEWRLYHMKKEEEKKRKELEKEERKRKRLEVQMKKSTSKKQLRTAKRRRKNSIENSDEQGKVGNTVDGDLKENKENNSAKNDLLTTSKPVAEAKIDDYVIVRYDERFYPGIIKEKKENEFKVNVMEPSGPILWKWPKKSDEIWYPVNDVVEIINAPILGHRETYKVPEILKLSEFYTII